MTMIFPAKFSDFDPYADWALETEGERYAKRLASSVEEMEALYDTVFPRLQEVLGYLDELPLNDLPEDATRLLWLTYSLVTATFPVEVWRQARVPDSGAAKVWMTLEPAV